MTSSLNPSLIANDVFNVHNFIGLAQLYADVFQTYDKVVKKYGVNTYSQDKFNGFLVDKYDEIEPKCNFDTFCKIIYRNTDVQGVYQLPDMVERKYNY